MSNLPVLYGITHDETTKLEIARVPRAVKVAIGRPKGPALHVCLVWNADRTAMGWQLEIGAGKQIEKRWFTLDEQDKLERDLVDLRARTPERKHPEKLGYFSFYRDRGDGQLVHDLESILLHGVKPTEIDIMFTDSSPFTAQYQEWGKKGKICGGDGLVAIRLNANAFTPAHKKLAEESAAAGNRHFLIQDHCFQTGCPRAGKDCKAHGALSFQLLRDIRVGSKAEVKTTARSSNAQLYASLKQLAVFLGGGDESRANFQGLPLVLNVRPFRTNHNDIPGVAYKLGVEFKAGTIKAMKEKILAAHAMFGLISKQESKEIEAASMKQLAAAPDPETIDISTLPSVEDADEGDDDDDGITASQNAAMFEGAEDGDGEDGDPDPEAVETVKETLAEAAAGSMQETEAKLQAAHAARLAAQQAAAPADAVPDKAAEPVDDLGASRYEKKEAPAVDTAAKPKKPLFGGKK